MFNPLDHRGIPLEQQIRNWRELDVEPIDPEAVDPYTRCRIITMNGIEVEAVMFQHQFARNCPDPEVRRELALVRYVESQQQRAVNWLLPGVSSVLETTLGYEQVAVDLTAWVARHEPDPSLRQAYEFGVLEDFDHLYRYANLYEMIEHRRAEKIVDALTEVMPGRPTAQQHRHPYDDVCAPYDKDAVDPRSKLNALTILSAEQQVMLYYMNVGPQYMEPIARQLYQEISLIEQEHVTHYESLLDPGENWWERLLIHQYNECWLYYSFMEQESDRRIKSLWELHLQMELGHLQQAAGLLRRHDGREPEQIAGAAGVPEPLRFEPNKGFLRHLLATQIDLTKLGEGYVREAHQRFEWMQRQVHGGEQPPSEDVIDRHRERFGGEYRIETDGPHPVESLRERLGAGRG
ncbi:hypothetical protein [Dactylosporangium sp. CA-139066]|uniref:hypothetical protein n=1 Tax=Dactylosporangium sp. CA-139066 TaxID=3239930 RepID=UPI003D90650E